DLVTANNASNYVTVLTGRGDGTFGAPVPFAVGPYPSGLVAGDFNGDGELDVATANALGQPVSVGLGLGNGTFAQPDLVASPARSAPLVSDFDGDGRPDVAVLRQDGAILVRFADPGSPGAFEPPVVVNTGPGQAARELSLLTAFGKNYLEVLSADRDTLSTYGYQPGHGIALLASTSIPNGLASHIVTGDLNGDGNDAVVLTLPATGQVMVETPQAYLTGLPPQLIDVGPGPSNAALVDTTGDGRLDIVVTDQFSGDVRVLYNDPAAPFSRQARFRAGTGLTGMALLGNSWEVHALDAPADLVGGPFSGSGGADLVVVNRGANAVALLRNDGEGGFLNPESPPAFLTGDQPAAVVAGRFTAGPDLDLAVLNKGSGDVTIFLGDGHGGFTRGATIPAGNDPTGLAVADLGGDGALDLLIGNAQGDVLMLDGNGDGTFRTYQRLDRHVGLAAADINGDGQTEFVFASQALDQVTVQYDGPGETWQQGRQDGVLSPNQVGLTDLNGDGILDLVVANGGGNDVLVYPGLGDGRFGSARRFFVGTDPVSVTAADLDGDGAPDLVVANKGSNDVSVLFGRGRGGAWTLAPGPRLRAGVGPTATAVADLTGDGVPDILVANGGSDDVYLLPGVGRGFFDDADPVTYQTGADPVRVFVGHFDTGPGLGLVTVNAGSGDVTY
ncbi:MAG TPA: VCBS repeat-containing protein, partial [Gemmataceae bacterium]|nr:VCBS repeat-containing protein [Gemmataceae bacterium]